MNLWPLIVLSFFALSCVPSSGGKSSRRLNSKVSATAKPTATSSGINKNRPPVYWYSADTVTTNITINQNNKSVIYLRGSAIETFLANNSNTTKTFCLIDTFNVAGAKSHFRARAVPFPLPDVTTGEKEWLFRIDLAENDASTTQCAGVALGVASAASAFQLSDLCSGCSSTIQAGRSYLFYATAAAGLVSQVADVTLNISSLGTKVDMKSVTSNPTGLCSDATCKSQGFDCCISTQCVINGSTRPGGSALPDYTQSQLDIVQNYTNIKNYKHIYYVCPSIPLPTPTATATPDAPSEAQAKLALTTKYWQCLTTPTSCAGLGLDYTTTRTTMWNECGCKSSNPTVDCKDWNYSPIYGTDGTTIVRFECYTPPPPSSTPLQSLKVNVSSKSVPHRFFRTTGVAVDDLASIFGSGVTNEGTQFSYLDEVNKLSPQNVSLNMNAILGQMSVELNKALPAKMVAVQQGNTYIISANKGLVSPCSKCMADKWNTSLRAYPSSTYGSGLRAYGHTTTRDVVSTNITNGNYEDTLFGRACWVPPTMLPFSHQKNASAQTQRLNRLETQAALWANGYRRDWFGFNLGALIGSFDGVRWFAIGQGRLISASSSKLFLAINAPMADLTDATSVTVNILQQLPGGTGETFTQHDWDFSKTNTDTSQNQGASCQQYHKCDSDGDCITQLGWEYMCADIGVIKTYWPIFSGVDETANDESSIVFSVIPKNGITGTGKRCIYRGPGALCKKNFINLPTNLRRAYTCAPNFYCAGLSASDFNQDIARELQIFDGIEFGQDANIPGRPKDYVTATSTLSATAISNLTYNFTNQHANFTADADYGLCRPGKAINSDSPLVQHQSKDASYRTDYISQISGCDSTMTDTIATFNRTRSCPVLNTDNDYTIFTVGTHSLPATRMQNLCGAESLDTSAASVFTLIEGATLNTAPTLIEKTFAKDACFRRAGATCFTDYDCAPNKLHAEIATAIGTTGFGGNKAEVTYWEEYLVCGQSDTFPSLSASNFKTYDLTLNKCCRPLEKTLTLSTAGNPEKINTTNEDPSFDSTFDETKQSVLNPATLGRYSRYTVVEDLGDASAAPDPYYAVPVVNMATLATATVPEEFQWMTIGETAETTCCGGGWIRKFSDGTHDWTKKNRLNINFEDFMCLNYINDVPIEKQNKTLQVVYDSEYADFCVNPQATGPLCWQVDMTSSTTFTIVPPTDAATAGPQSVSTVSLAASNNIYAPYDPSVPTSSCSVTVGAYTVLDTRGVGQYVARVVADGVNQSACIYLPSYINGFANIRQVDFIYDSFPFDGIINGLDTPSRANVLRLSDGAFPAFPVGDEFWEVDSNNGIFIWGDTRLPVTDDIYVQIWFNAPQTEDYRMDGDNAASNVAALAITSPEALVAGNDLYYLNLLGRLELLGIPQITYPALYCNSNRSKLVPGIFDATTRTQFEAATFSFTDANIVDTVANVNQKTTTNQKVALNDVFSTDEMVCCAYLGKTVDSISKCCTNYGVANGSGKFTCKLPDGADLNVYFNRFVTSDGVGSTQPNGGFINTDFDDFTGEPKLDANVYAKIKAMGVQYCESQTTVTGGAFGDFETSPPSGSTTRFWGIVDESTDAEPIATDTPTPVPNDPRGAEQFSKGLKWNHHLYCGTTSSS